MADASSSREVKIARPAMSKNDEIAAANHRRIVVPQSPDARYLSEAGAVEIARDCASRAACVPRHYERHVIRSVKLNLL